LAASAVHSLVDFVWYVPACMAMVAILAACACRLAQLAARERGSAARPLRLPAPAALVTAVLLVALGAWMLSDRVAPVAAAGHWNRVRTMVRAMDEPFAAPDVGRSDTASCNPAGTEYTSVLHASAGDPAFAEEALVAELKQIVRFTPDDAEAHLELANAYLQWFHRCQEGAVNRMTLEHVCDAVIQSQRKLPSREAFDAWLAEWLPVAVGDHYRYLYQAIRHARRGLALCPLKGRGYLYLGELSFLEDGTRTTWSAYVDQATRVRPNDGDVLFHAGKEAQLAGDPERGLECWRRAFHGGRKSQRKMIDRLAGRLGPGQAWAEIQFALVVFEPDLEALRYLEERYRPVAGPEELRPLLTAHARAAEAEAAGHEGPQAASLWLEAMSLRGDLGQNAQALACARQALEADPNRYAVRVRLGMCLADAGQLDEAQRHLQWCLQRKPNHRAVENKLRQIARRRMDVPSPTAAAGGTGGRVR
jgi:tetratricopeptide (TPR) repeat protein